MRDAHPSKFSITAEAYEIILDESKRRGHLGEVMSFLRQIEKTETRAAFASDCAVYCLFGGAIADRHMSRGVELTTWRRT